MYAANDANTRQAAVSARAMRRIFRSRQARTIFSLWPDTSLCMLGRTAECVAGLDWRTYSLRSSVVKKSSVGEAASPNTVSDPCKSVRTCSNDASP